jgi:hypothetical protein
MTPDSLKERCARCSDDGWIEVFDDDDNVIGAKDCPYLEEPWHREFNATGVLDRDPSCPSCGLTIGHEPGCRA